MVLLPFLSCGFVSSCLAFVLPVCCCLGWFFQKLLTRNASSFSSFIFMSVTVATELSPNILFRADFIEENFLSGAAVRTSCLCLSDKPALSSSFNACTESEYSTLYTSPFILNDEISHRYVLSFL